VGAAASPRKGACRQARVGDDVLQPASGLRARVSY
jgi:hypothetical protein